jgi:hypothetical protein
MRADAKRVREGHVHVSKSEGCAAACWRTHACGKTEEFCGGADACGQIKESRGGAHACG